MWQKNNILYNAEKICTLYKILFKFRKKKTEIEKKNLATDIIYR